MTKHPRKPAPLPSKAQVLEFIQDSPGRVGKRELARAFNLTAEQRPFLRQIMKELEEDGSVQRGHKRTLHRPGALPDVAVIQISGTDEHGELLGRPFNWTEDGPPPRIFLQPVRRDLPSVGIGDRVLCKMQFIGNNQYQARVMKKLVEAPARVLGLLEVGTNGLFLRPTDRRDRQDYVVARGDTGGAEAGELVEAEVLPGRAHGLRQVRVLDRLGSLTAPKAVSLIAIHAQGIPTEFTQGALDQAEAAGPVPLGTREDLRDIPLVTIDGEDARDFDDAVWAEADPAGGWHAIVAIADVAHYVYTGSPLDKCAYERGNSVYFPDRVVPMLPEALSNGWCSLRPNEERGCLAVHMWFDAKGNKTRHRFVRGLMRSAARLTYTQVQNGLDGRPDDTTGPLMDSVIAPLFACYKALRSARNHRGALEIEIAERKVVLADDGSVVGIVPRPSWDSHKLIEELMIAANVSAAETLEERQQPCMYRVHDEPPMERLEALRGFLQTINLNLPTGALRPQNFNSVINKVRGTSQEHLVNTVILRSQSQAIYTPENRGHFGLGLRRYAHFTSPIRRYSDLLVHRALIRGLGFGTAQEALTAEQAADFELIGEHISQTERRAALAERDVIERYTALYLSERIGAEFAGRVTSVTRFGLFVELEDSGASGLIPISSLGTEFFVHDEANHRLVTRSQRTIHQLGDAVIVKLRQADPVTGGMLFEMRANLGGAPKDGWKAELKPAPERPQRPARSITENGDSGPAAAGSEDSGSGDDFRPGAFGSRKRVSGAPSNRSKTVRVSRSGGPGGNKPRRR